MKTLLYEIFRFKTPSNFAVCPFHILKIYTKIIPVIFALF